MSKNYTNININVCLNDTCLCENVLCNILNEFIMILFNLRMHINRKQTHIQMKIQTVLVYKILLNTCILFSMTSTFRNWPTT